MGNRTNNKTHRCFVCYMRKEICICNEIKECRESLSTQTKILILMHHRERHLTTNTARIAALSIPNCSIHVRGLPQKPLNCAELIEEDRETLLLFPRADAKILSKDFLATLKKPIQLVVPDGSWRQAYKVSKREEALKNAHRVVLPVGGLSEYKLRREPKDSGLATFEAIARAMGIIEGPEIQHKLEKLFRTMVSRTLKSRGYVNPETRDVPK